MSALTREDVVSRYKLIQEIVTDVFKKDVHYGKPYGGSNKEVLLKAGAEVLNVTFQLCPEYKTEVVDLGNGHREYRVETRIISQTTGTAISGGVGSCSTMEIKYRWRNIDEATEIPVSETAWNLKRSGDLKGMKRLLREELENNGIDIPEDANVGFVKTPDGWFISIKAKSENPDIADTYNTVWKQAKKRSHIDATLTALGISSMFTQDVDEFPDYDRENEDKSSGDERKPTSPPPKSSGGQNTRSRGDRSSQAKNEGGPPPGVETKKPVSADLMSQVEDLVGYVPEDQKNEIRKMLIGKPSERKISNVLSYLRARKVAYETLYNLIDSTPEDPKHPLHKTTSEISDRLAAASKTSEVEEITNEVAKLHVDLQKSS